VEVTGSGVELKMKSRKDELVNALNQRRAQGGSTGSYSASSPDDPVALLERLSRLRDAGVRTEQEFAAKKAELLARIT
jgi:hypothetical protein